MAGFLTYLDSLLALIGLPEIVHYIVLTSIKIGIVLLPLIIAVAYFTYAERKIIGYMQNRPWSQPRRLVRTVTAVRRYVEDAA